MLNMAKMYNDLVNQVNPKLSDKIKRAKSYMLQLARNIQKLVEEERQNAS